MAANVLLITGANTGLGYQTVRALLALERPYEILLGGRSLEKVDQAIKEAGIEFTSSKSKLHPIQIDVEEDESIERAVQIVKNQFGKLDTLINNAGTQLDQQVVAGRMSAREMWNQTWNVNTAGTHILTNAMMPLLLKSHDPRLLFITSGTSTLAGSDDLSLFVNKSPPAGWPKADVGIPAYRSAKTGLNMMMRHWHRLLKEDHVKVWCISPGYLATGLGGSQTANKQAGAGDPAAGGEFVRKVVEGHRDEYVGEVIRATNVQPW